jgi:hypothetical protein
MVLNKVYVFYGDQKLQENVWKDLMEKMLKYLLKNHKPDLTPNVDECYFGEWYKLKLASSLEIYI